MQNQRNNLSTSDNVRHASLGDLSQSSDPTRIDVARSRLSNHGILLLDDDKNQLDTLRKICAKRWGISPDKALTVEVYSSDTFPKLVDRIETILRRQFEQTGNFVAGIITDYNITPSVTSLDIWKAVELSLLRAGHQEAWRATGRVLATGARINPEISEAIDNSQIDFCVAKPFKISTLTDAVEASVAKRLDT
jgi:hypothetical protein